MRILYGVVGEGMGHALRSKVVLDYLVGEGHQILIVVSGRAHRFLTEHFRTNPRVQIEEIHGLHLSYEGNAVDLPETVATNIQQLPKNLRANFEAYRRVVRAHFEPDAVISDFESWAYSYGKSRNIPVISVDNIQVIDRCLHDRRITRESRFDFNLARLTVRAKMPRAYYYLVSSFFYPIIRRPKTTLVPPILRPEILNARHCPGEHILVYQTASANTALVPTLQGLPFEFRVYGMGREGRERNVTLCAFSEEAFVHDLRTARAAISGGSYTLMGEAVHLGIPMLSFPLEGQFEQELNARYLADLGYGDFARKLDGPTVRRFLEGIPEFSRNLQSYAARDNSFLYRCLDELLWRISRRDPAPAALSCPALGDYRLSAREGMEVEEANRNRFP